MAICLASLSALKCPDYCVGAFLKLYPHTGTPVSGGLELEAAFHLCQTIVRSGRSLIGFDICEVGDEVWDGNVAGSQLLSQNLGQISPS